MSTKKKVPTSTPRPVKKERKAIDLDTKLKVIKQHEEGKKVNMIARDFKLSHSTVSTILKDKDRICEVAKGSAPMRATVITKQRIGPIHEMEKLLFLWMEDQIQKRTPLSLLTVQSKARSLFDTLKERAGKDYTQTFIASTGWFKRFKRRFNLHSVRVTGESASADVKGAEGYVKSLDKIITEGGYQPEQIFNVDETALLWKKMPDRSYIHQEAKTMPGFKAHKDRLTLLLGGNIAGFKLKPFLIYRSENPRAFKNVNKNNLPVYFRSNRKAWMTQKLFEDWFLNCFVPQIHEYCLENEIAFKIILILDNAPGHPPILDHLHSDVKVVYLPPNTTSLIQPMDQGAIATFKAYYLRTTFAQAIAATDSNPELPLQQFWKEYDIYKCIKNIAVAWEAVTKKCMIGIWKKCVPRLVSYNNEFDNDYELDIITENIARLADRLSLEIGVEDVEQMITQETDGDLTNEELIYLEEQRITEEERKGVEKNKDEEEPERKFTTRGLSEGFSLLNKLLEHFEEMDPDIERFSGIRDVIQDAFRPYSEIYDQRRKRTIQTKINMFMKQTPTKSCGHIDEPHPSTSSQ